MAPVAVLSGIESSDDDLLNEHTSLGTDLHLPGRPTPVTPSDLRVSTFHASPERVVDDGPKLATARGSTIAGPARSGSVATARVVPQTTQIDTC